MRPAPPDPPGTCHLVGCPDKGRHPPHPIGCPETFAPYQQPNKPAKVLLSQDDVVAILDTAKLDHGLLHRLSLALAVARNTVSPVAVRVNEDLVEVTSHA